VRRKIFLDSSRVAWQSSASRASGSLVLSERRFGVADEGQRVAGKPPGRVAVFRQRAAGVIRVARAIALWFALRPRR
jgi:hypothetical protein